MRFVRGVIGFIEDEGANGVETRRGHVGQSAVYTEPWREGDEVVVGGRQVALTGDIVGDEIVLLGVACGIGIDVRHIEEALNDAIKCFCIRRS